MITDVVNISGVIAAAVLRVGGTGGYGIIHGKVLRRNRYGDQATD
jgi:hypothetical protein